MCDKDKEHIVVKTPCECFVLKGRPCELSAFSYVPERRTLPPHLTYYNTAKNDRYSYSEYDRMFLKDFGYDSHLHREDRIHYKQRGLHVNREEHCRTIPLLSSSIYGHRLPSDLDPVDRKHAHVEIVTTEFFRKNGTNMTPDLKFDSCARNHQ